MKNTIPEDIMYKLLDGATDTLLRTIVLESVGRHYKSSHYKSSLLLCDCIVLNLIINDCITPSSANEIITTLHRKNKALYTTVESGYLPIENKFNEYAKSILPNYEEVVKLDMRTINFIVYVISYDIKTTRKFNKYEIIYKAFTFAEREKYGLQNF